MTCINSWDGSETQQGPLLTQRVTQKVKYDLGQPPVPRLQADFPIDRAV